MNIIYSLKRHFNDFFVFAWKTLKILLFADKCGINKTLSTALLERENQGKKLITSVKKREV
jgi:hypothetical protein